MNKLIVATIYLLWFAAVFDPIGKLFMLRYVALSLGIASLFVSRPISQVLGNMKSYRSLMIVYISFVMPLYGLVLYVIRGGWESSFIDTSYLAGGLLFLISLIYSNIDLARSGLFAMVVSLRLMVVLIFAVFLEGVFELDADWTGFLTKTDQARIGVREFVGVKFPYIYFLASPMLIFLIGYELNNLHKNICIKNIAICIVVILAFTLTGTRAHIIIGMIYVPFLWIVAYTENRLLLMMISGFILTLIINIFFADFVEAMFSVREASNLIKINMLDNYIDMFSDPYTLLFGQGYNAHAWSSKLNELLVVDGASKTELTYLELVRVYGVFISLFFCLLIIGLLYRLTKLSGEFRWLFSALFLYLVNASLNPYLFSTNGMLPLGLVAAILLWERKRVIGLRSIVEVK